MHNIYLLCGPSLSGKSTAAARIVESTRGAIVSADEINRERGLPFGGEGLPESTWADTLKIQLERLRAHVQAGTPTIIDDTLCYRWLRDRFRGEAERLGAAPLLLVFAPSKEEIHRRHALVTNSGERPALSLERLRDHLARFEWPEPDENPIDVTDSQSLELFLRRIRIHAEKAT